MSICGLYSGDAPNISELIELLQRFVETSTLGEYATRVKMLDVFYHQLLTEDKTVSGDNGEVLNLCISSFLRTVVFSWKSKNIQL